MATTLTTTRAEIRSRLAMLFGDRFPLTATGGSTTTFIDTQHLTSLMERPDERQLVFLSGLNEGLVRRVTDANLSTGTLTVATLPNAVIAGDTAELYNFRAKGGTYAEYNDAIRMAQDAAWPAHRVRVVLDIAALFDDTTGEIEIPVEIVEIETLEYQDTDALWQTVPRAASAFATGWSVEPVNGVLTVRDQAWTGPMDGVGTRLRGWARETPMDDDNDTTTIHPDWLVWQAKRYMHDIKVNQGIDQQFHYNQSLVAQQEADKLRKKLVTRTGYRVAVR